MFAEKSLVEIKATKETGTVLDIGQWAGKGYDFIRDPGAAFAANLEGSVAGINWTTIVALAASGQGAIPDHYNYIRVDTGTAGALGATTRLVAAGRVG